MVYEFVKRTIKDKTNPRPGEYFEQTKEDGAVKHVPAAPDTEPGTDLDAEHMQRYEDAIDDHQTRINQLVNDQPQAPETMTQDNPTCTVIKSNPSQGTIVVTGSKTTHLLSSDFREKTVTDQSASNRSYVSFDDIEQMKYYAGKNLVLAWDESLPSTVKLDCYNASGGYWGEKVFNNGVLIQLPDGIHARTVLFYYADGWDLNKAEAFMDSFVMSDKAFAYTGPIEGTQVASHIVFDLRSANVLDLREILSQINSYGGHIDENGDLKFTSFPNGKKFCFQGVKKDTQYRLAWNWIALGGNVSPIYTYTDGSTHGSASISTSGKTLESITFYYGGSPTGLIIKKDSMIAIGTELPSEYISPNCSVIYLGEELSDNDKASLSEDGSIEIEKNVKCDVLDGSYALSLRQINATCHRINFHMTDEVINPIVTKYNGKHIIYNGAGDIIDYAGWDGANKYLVVAIDPKDSGWALNYDPTKEEIKACVNGWVMHYWNGSTHELYSDQNGDGTGKVWLKRYQNIGEKVAITFGGSCERFTNMDVCPKEKAYGDITKCYEIWYDLEEPDIYMKHTSPLQLASGVTHVTAQSGIIVDEKVEPKLKSGTGYVVNYMGAVTDAHSPTLHPVLRFIKIEKVLTDDHGNRVTYDDTENWVVTAKASGEYGGDYYIKCSEDDYDSVAEYYVTYQETTNSGVFSATLTYKDSLPDAVEKNAKGVSRQANQIMLLQNEVAKLSKHIQWLEPTLLNGATTPSSNPVQYCLDNFGFVHIKGVIDPTTINTNAFRLPQGMRPKAERGFTCYAYDSIGEVANTRVLLVDINGYVKPITTQAVNIAIVFKAGE